MEKDIQNCHVSRDTPVCLFRIKNKGIYKDNSLIFDQCTILHASDVKIFKLLRGHFK